MDSTKRDLIDFIRSLANTEPIIHMIVDEYATKYKRDRDDVIQSHVNDMVMDIVEKVLKHNKETEEIVKTMLSKDKWVLNIY